jgi:hypothetical protein
MPKNPDGTGSDGKFKPEYIEQAAKLGATDFEIAEFFNVDTKTLRSWKHRQPGFADSLQLGKDEADARVERALFQRAVGYSFDSEKIMQHEGEVIRAEIVEHLPPDVKAAEYWRNNRKSAQGMSRKDHTGSYAYIAAPAQTTHNAR